MGAGMTHAQYLRIEKLTRKNIVEIAARHNHREILAELGAAQGGHIDAARSGFNRILRGSDTAAAVANQARMLMGAAGIKTLRKDAVRALEIIFSLPPESPIDQDRFFSESVQWVEQYFAAPIISAIVHNDEAAPHCHVLVLPLVDGRMVGSDLMGGPAKLKALQADFHAQVAQRHGLRLPRPQKHYNAVIRLAAAQMAIDALHDNGELCGTSDAIVEEIRALIAANPEKLLSLMGRTMPTPATIKGGFVKMMTKPCKPEKPIGFGKKKPIGFDGSATFENKQTLSCVGFVDSPPPFPPPSEAQKTTQDQPPAPAIALTDSASIRSKEIEPSSVTSTASSKETTTDLQPTDTEGDYIRVRDNEQPTKQWSDELGEFIMLPVKQSAKRAATSLVRLALASKNGLVCGGTL